MAIARTSAGNAAPVFSSTAAAPGTGPSEAPVRSLALRDGNVSIDWWIHIWPSIPVGTSHVPNVWHGGLRNLAISS